MWKLTPHARWQEMTHFHMQNAPQMGHRIRFVKALVYVLLLVLCVYVCVCVCVCVCVVELCLMLCRTGGRCPSTRS